jgi:hypothetical protein
MRTLKLAAGAAMLTALAISSAGAAALDNGLTVNGLTVNGLTVNGLTVNGLTVNGLTVNGRQSGVGLDDEQVMSVVLADGSSVELSR